MAYDALTESLRLIESGEVIPVVSRLSRRRRHAPIAVDVAGEIAVTVFVRRSVGCSVEETHVLARHGGEWFLLGGGGGPAADDALHDRPAELSQEPWALPGVDPRLVALEGSGGCRDTRAKNLWRPFGRWINYSTVRVSADVARVVVNDRQIAVPWHGRVVVVWQGRRPQEVVLLDYDGASLGRAKLRPSL